MDNCEVKISVIVTTYNQEKTIARTLDSILSQKCHASYEIELSDDASTDSTAEICRRYAVMYPDKIRLNINATNEGLVDNYFNAFLRCRGEFIADCAGDDYWVDNLKLEKEVTILEENSNISLVHTNWNTYNESTKVVRNNLCDKKYCQSVINGHKLLLPVITQTQPVVHLCTSLYRKELIEKAYNEDTFLFRNKDFGCEDIQIIFTSAQNGDIAYLNDVTLHYSVGHDSISNTNSDIRQFDFVYGTTHLSLYLARKNNLLCDSFYKYLNDKMYALIMHVFRSNDNKRREKLKTYIKENNIKIDYKTKFIIAITSNMCIWSLFSYVRNCYIKIIQLKNRFNLLN